LQDNKILRKRNGMKRQRNEPPSMATWEGIDLPTDIGSSEPGRKAQIVLLYTRDGGFGGVVGEALSGTGSVVLVARTVADALQIVGQRGRELAFALMDFDGGCRGMTLLSAIHTCFEELPILVTTSKDAEDVRAVAFANGARACLPKPAYPAGLANAISEMITPDHQLAAA
jgi:DNA-binding response OmpR family regulator